MVGAVGMVGIVETVGTVDGSTVGIVVTGAEGATVLIDGVVVGYVLGFCVTDTPFEGRWRRNPS